MPLLYALATGSQALESHDWSDDFVRALEVGALAATITGAGWPELDAADAEEATVPLAGDAGTGPGAIGGWPSRAGFTRSGVSDDTEPEPGAADIAVCEGSAGLATTVALCATGFAAGAGTLAAGAAVGSFTG